MITYVEAVIAEDEGALEADNRHDINVKVNGENP